MKTKIIVPGYACNNYCIMCQYRDRRSVPDKPTYKIISEINNAKNNGHSMIDFSGGEFLLRNDWKVLVEYAKSLELKVNILTNGIAFSYVKYAKAAHDLGIDSVTFSIQGHNKSLHDMVTENPGSFEKLKHGIKNIKKYNIPIKAKICISKPNYKYLYKIAKMIFDKGIRDVEFVFVSPFGNASEKFKAVVPKLSDAVPHIRAAIEFGRKNFLKNWFVTGVPFCFLPGYDDLVRDQDEDSIVDDLCFFKSKPDKCKKCFYFDKCSGVWNSYYDDYGTDELCPVLEEPERNSYILIRPSIYEPYLEIIDRISFSLGNLQPTGLLKISTYLKSKGNYIYFLDCLKDLDTERIKDRKDAFKKRKFVRNIKAGRKGKNLFFEQYHYGISFDDFCFKLNELKNHVLPKDILITTSMTYYYEPIFEISKICKKVFPKADVKIGGIYATLCPEHAKQSGAEVFAGEFEEANNLSADLDILDYGPSYAIIKSTRGCPNNCSYCAVSKLEGRKMRYRDIDLVLDEMIEKYEVYGIKEFRFYESNLLLNMEKHFCILLDKIINSGLKVTLSCPEGFEISRLNSRLVKKMQKAGFKFVNLALESSDDSMLERFHKPIKSSDFAKALKAIEGSGIKRIRTFILVGLPEQNYDGIINSLVYVWKHFCETVILPFTPIPGTEEYEISGKEVKEKPLEELHPILMPCASKNLTEKDLYEIYLFNENIDPVTPEPALYYILLIDPRSRVAKSIVDKYYEGNINCMVEKANKRIFTQEQKNTLKRYKNFFRKIS